MVSHDASLDGKLAARFGRGALAKQAVRQALVSRNKQLGDTASVLGDSHAVMSIPLGQPRQMGSNPSARRAAGAAIPGVQFADLKNRSPSPQRGNPGSLQQQYCKATDEESPSEMDEIMGVVEALGGARRDLAACCSSDEQRRPASSLSIRADPPLRGNDVAAVSPASVLRGVSRSKAEVQLQEDQQNLLQHQEVQQQPSVLHAEQQQPVDGSQPPSPVARHARASVLSSRAPPGKGPVTVVKPSLFSFEEADPILADKHYLRTKEQDRMLEQDRAQSPSSRNNSGSKSSSGCSPVKKRPGTAQSASAAGSPLRTQRHYASSCDSVDVAGFSVRPRSAVALRSKSFRSSEASGLSSPVAAAVHNPAAVVTTFEQQQQVLSSVGACETQGWASPAAFGNAAKAHAAAAEVDIAGNNSSSTGGSVAARQELLKVMKQAQQAMAASAHLRTRQITHLPAASSSLATQSSSAAAAAASAAADALASRGVVVAGSRQGPGSMTPDSVRPDSVRSSQRSARASEAGANTSSEAAAAENGGNHKFGCQVSHLEDGSALLLSGGTLSTDAAALIAVLGRNGVQSAEQLLAIAASTGKPDELEDVIQAINAGAGLEQLHKPWRQQQKQQQQHDDSTESLVQQHDTGYASDSSGTASSNARHTSAAGDSDAYSETRIACGAFDENRYDKFTKQVDAEMERRAAEHDYDSDLEEEEKAAMRANGEAADALLELQDAERKLEELNGQHAQLQATWAEQDEWMNAYRQPLEQQQQQPYGKSGSEADDEQEGEAQQTPQPHDSWQQSQQQRRSHDIAAVDAAAARGKAAAQSVAAAAAMRCQGAVAAAAAAAAGTTTADRPGSPTARADRSSGHGPSSKRHQVLSPADEQLISMPFIPRMAQSSAEGSAALGAQAANPAYQEQQFLDRPAEHGLKEQQQGHAVCGCNSDNGSGNDSMQERSRELQAHTACDASGAGGSYANEAKFVRSQSASPLKTTIARPFAVESAAAIKPKSITAVKLEQDLVLKAQEEEAHYRRRFVASPIPASTLEPRYLNIIADQAAKRAVNVSRYKDLLASKECPFTFYERDKEAAAAKAAQRAAAKDPNRFQRPFKAKPVPAHVHEPRYETTAVGLEAARLAAKVRAEMAREKAAAKLQEAYKKRQQFAEAAYKERLTRSSCSHSQKMHRQAWHPTNTNQDLDSSTNLSKSTPALAHQLRRGEHSKDECVPLHRESSGLGMRGQSCGSALMQRSRSAGSSCIRVATVTGQCHNPVPDFKVLHTQWETRMAAIKAANRRRVTVPEEFRLNGSTPEEQTERAKKQADHRARIISSMQEDAHNLKELRWPYLGSRAPVHPTPPPVYAGNTVRPKSADAGGTLAAQLRVEATRKAMAAGRFDTKEKKERHQWEALKAEQQQRQQQWQVLQASELRKRLEQHQQQLEHQRQKRMQQGLASTSLTGGGSATDQTRGTTAAGVDAASTTAAAAGGMASLDAAVAAAAGLTVTAASAVQCSTPPSAAEVAAHLDQLLKGKAVIKPAQLEPKQQQQQPVGNIGTCSAVNNTGGGSNSSSPRKSSNSPGWVRRMIMSSKKKNFDKLRQSGEEAAGTGGRPSTGAAPVACRAGLSGRVEAPLMHIQARHAQAEKAAREMVEDALLQQGIEAYRYVKG